MELTEEQSKLLGPFVDATVSCLKTLGGMNAIVGPGVQEDLGNFSINDYVFVIETSGIVSGRVIMHYHMEASLDIGNKIRSGLLGDDCDKATVVDENIIDALSELSNIIVGRAVHSIDNRDTLITFSPPQYISEPSNLDLLKSGVKQILSIPVEVENIGKFHVNYLIQNISEI